MKSFDSNDYSDYESKRYRTRRFTRSRNRVIKRISTDEIVEPTKKKEYNEDSEYRPEQEQEKKKKKVKNTLFSRERVFQKRKQTTDLVVDAMMKETIGTVAAGWKVQLKPCRRSNTGYATSGLIPYFVCSAPYKYLLTLSWSESLDEERELDFFLTKFKNGDPTGKKLLDGIIVEKKKVEFKNGSHSTLFHLQFQVTSFLNKSVEFKLNILGDNEPIFRSEKFRIVARKNKIYDDKFWDSFKTVKVSGKKRGRKDFSSTRKRRKRSN